MAVEVKKRPLPDVAGGFAYLIVGDTAEEVQREITTLTQDSGTLESEFRNPERASNRKYFAHGYVIPKIRVVK